MSVTFHFQNLRRQANLICLINTRMNFLFQIATFNKFMGTYSIKFHVTNGVKQGGILSSCLFNVYMNNLSLS